MPAQNDSSEPTQVPFSAFPRWMTAGGNKPFHNFYNDYSHISDPNLRRRMALTEVDKVPFGLYHVQAVLVAGVGFFVDSYTVYSLNLITTLLGVVFWSDRSRIDGYGGNGGYLPNTVAQALKMSTIGGMIVGQVMFGCLADVYGRRKMYGVELGLIIIATLGFTISSSSLAVSSTSVLVFWRVVLGLAIGGEYPNSSVITSEFAPTRWRGGMIAAVNGMQALGQLLAAIVAIAAASGFRAAYAVADEAACGLDCRIAADRSWRLIAGVGAVPAILALYYRITIPETPRYTFDVAHDIVKADADISAFVSRRRTGDLDKVQQAKLKTVAGAQLHIPRASWSDFQSYVGQVKHWRVLAGTAWSWFFVDFCVYGLSLNSTQLLRAIGYGRGDTLHEKLVNQAVGTMILAAAGSVPGFILAVLTVDTIGRKIPQFFGFLSLVVLFCVLGFALPRLGGGAILALLVLVQFVLAAGPSTTTFIVPAEVFPTRYRATGHGASAASGKVGALAAQLVSIPLLTTSPGQGDACAPDGWGVSCPDRLDRLFQIFGLMALCGAVATVLIPTTKGITLEELGGEPPTSYNAGRNGSIGVVRRRSRWNPFEGGQPAGFDYPRSSRVAGSRSRDRPDHEDEDEAERGQAGDRGRGGAGAGSQGAKQSGAPMAAGAAGAAGPASFWSRGRVGTDDSASSVSSIEGEGAQPRGPATPRRATTTTTSQGPSAATLQVPNWGAGWGRIDRGACRLRMESLRLEDVSNLLTDGGGGQRGEVATIPGSVASPGSAVSPGSAGVPEEDDKGRGGRGGSAGKGKGAEILECEEGEKERRQEWKDTDTAT